MGSFCGGGVSFKSGNHASTARSAASAHNKSTSRLAITTTKSDAHITFFIIVDQHATIRPNAFADCTGRRSS